MLCRLAPDSQPYSLVFGIWCWESGWTGLLRSGPAGWS